MTIRARVVLWGILLLAVQSSVAFSQSGGATGAGGMTVCFGQYALCSSAPCYDDPHETGKKVVCDCEIPPEGLNLGNSSCESRGENLTSTFSLGDVIEGKRSLICKGENPDVVWAFCLDSHCKPTGRGTATCTCEPRHGPEYNTLGGGCDPTQCKAPTKPHEPPYKYWSGATVTQLLRGYDQLWVFYEKIPLLSFCSE